MSGLIRGTIRAGGNHKTTLVSVLDLDNLFVSDGIFKKTRGRGLEEPSKARMLKNRTEMTTLLRSIKQCC